MFSDLKKDRVIHKAKFKDLCRKQKIVRIVLTVLLIVGMIGFLSGFVVSCCSSNYSKSTTEFPLGDFRGIVVDNEGRIFCGTHFYGRVQVYDKNGAFLYAITVSDRFKMKLNDDGNVYIAKGRNEVYIVNGNGDLVKQYIDDNCNDKFGDVNEYEFIDKDNNVYEISNTLMMFPKVIKISPDGNERTIVETPIYLILIMGPLPAWLYLIMAVLLGCYERYKYKNK